jgi:hypothetical protein
MVFHSCVLNQRFNKNHEDISEPFGIYYCTEGYPFLHNIIFVSSPTTNWAAVTQHPPMHQLWMRLFQDELKPFNLNQTKH